MDDSLKNLKELLGKDLSSFKIEELFEVWNTDEKGIKTTPIGAFKNEKVAKAFAGNDKSNWGNPAIIPIMVLTDGVNVFVVDENRRVKTFNDEEEALRLKKIALDKISPEDRELLGIW